MKQRGSYIRHFKSNIRLAFPVMITQLGHPLVGFSSSVILSYFAGTVPLAGLALANGYFNLLLIIGIGMAYGLTPLVARANGSGDLFVCGRLLAHSLLINLFTGLVLLITAVAGSCFVLNHIGQHSDIVLQAKPLLFLLGISLFPLMIFLTFKQFVEGLGFTRQAMQVSLWGNAINIVVGIVLVKGMFGIAPMGIKGIGYAAIADRTIMAFVMGMYALAHKRIKPFLRGFAFTEYRYSIFKTLFETGLPITLQYIFEISVFSIAVFMTGWLGAPQLAAYQSVMIMVSLIYYAVVGIGTAATINTGYFSGKQYYHDLKISAFSSYYLVLAFHVVTGLLLLTFRNMLSHFFSTDATVILMISHLFILVSVIEVFDGLQVVGLGVLRGLGDTRMPTFITMIAYWLFALPMAYFLGFYTSLGLYGIWIGLYCGLGIAAIGLFLRFVQLSNRKLFLQPV